jgi:hypothetical protein
MEDFDAPATKMRRIVNPGTVFKQLTEIKDHPALIFIWLQQATEQYLKTGGAYAIHLLVTSGRMDLVHNALSVIDVTCDNVTDPEVAILLVQYLSRVNLEHMLTATPMIERFVRNLSVRKRIVDLFLEGAYRYQAWDLAKDTIMNFLCGNPFTAEVSDLLPFAEAPSHIKTEVLSWFINKEIYAPTTAEGQLTCEPSADLQYIPTDMSDIADEIYKKLPLKSGSPLPISTILKLQDVKYIIDGANVLFSYGEHILSSIINYLKPLGKVAVVIHCRHVNGKDIFKAHPEVVTVKTPYGVNDDYYAIWLAMSHSAYLVTNDLFRDHVYHISPAIRSWRKNAVIGFTNDNLIWPIKFSHCIQRIGDTFWIPTVDPGQWLKIHI